MKNCERYKTSIDRTAAFDSFCKRQGGCGTCELDKKSNGDCHFAWLELEYKEENELMACPYCGGTVFLKGYVLAGGSPMHYIKCSKCNFATKTYFSTKEAVEQHNRFCKAIAAYKEGATE